MTEQDALKKLDFMQSVRYENDVIEVYFDVETVGDFRGSEMQVREGAQAFYRGANITNLVNWEEIDQEINWKRVREEMNDY